MSETDTLHGLACPRCGGMVPIPEGQVIAVCPYCDMRSFVRGERGLRRFQVPGVIDKPTASKALKRFLSGKMAVARDAAAKAQLSEIFLTFVPFWVMWARALAWAFGQKRVGSGDNKRYEPREVRIVEEMTWNSAALDIGEFGVNRVPLTTQALEPFEPESLHAQGMVFEPVSSHMEAKAAAAKSIEKQVKRKAGLDRLNQLFLRFFNQRFGLVYYPMWVIRYLYRGRAFQVVVDGHTGDILYGKGPGNTLYRAAVLVAGMALGAFLAVDASTFFFLLESDEGDAFMFGFVLIAVGLGIMYAAYRAFRYGEQYEYKSGGSKVAEFVGTPEELLEQVKDVTKWVDQLS